MFGGVSVLSTCSNVDYFGDFSICGIDFFSVLSIGGVFAAKIPQHWCDMVKSVLTLSTYCASSFTDRLTQYAARDSLDVENHSR